METTHIKKQTFKSASIESINWELDEIEVIKFLEESDEKTDNSHYTQRYTANNVRPFCEHENRVSTRGQGLPKRREIDPTESEYNELPIGNQHGKRTPKSSW